MSDARKLADLIERKGLDALNTVDDPFQASATIQAALRAYVSTGYVNSSTPDEIIEWIAGQTRVQHCTPAWCLTDTQIRALKGTFISGIPSK